MFGILPIEVPTTSAPLLAKYGKDQHCVFMTAYAKQRLDFRKSAVTHIVKHM